MKFSIRILYLYLFSFIGLLIAAFGTIRLIELGLKVYVFKGADTFEYARPVIAPGEKELTEEEAKMDEETQKAIQERETVRQRQRETAGALAMIFVGTPIYLYHWNTIKKEKK